MFDSAPKVITTNIEFKYVCSRRGIVKLDFDTLNLHGKLPSSPRTSFFCTNKPNNKNILEIDKRHVPQRILCIWFNFETIFGIFLF